jgi:hypothetical protein
MPNYAMSYEEFQVYDPAQEVGPPIEETFPVMTLEWLRQSANVTADLAGLAQSEGWMDRSIYLSVARDKVRRLLASLDAIAREVDAEVERVYPPEEIPF